MKIELRNVAYNARLSEETSAYAADVWIDGKKAGTTQNAGHGGPDLIRPRELEEKLTAYALTLPVIKSKWGDLPESAETLLGGCLTRFLTARDLKRALKTKLLFMRAGKVMGCKVGSLGWEPEAARLLPGDGPVLNGLPFEEALTLFMSPA
jgi:hypothetical protein